MLPKSSCFYTSDTPYRVSDLLCKSSGIRVAQKQVHHLFFAQIRFTHTAHKIFHRIRDAIAYVNACLIKLKVQEENEQKKQGHLRNTVEWKRIWFSLFFCSSSLPNAKSQTIGVVFCCCCCFICSNDDRSFKPKFLFTFADDFRSRCSMHEVQIECRQRLLISTGVLNVWWSVCVFERKWEKKVRHIEIKNRAVSSNGKRIQLDELCSWFTQFNDPYTNQALLDMKFVVIHLLKPIHTY